MKSLSPLILALMIPISSQAIDNCFVTPTLDGEYTITIEGPIANSGTTKLSCMDAQPIVNHMREMSSLVESLLYHVEGLLDPDASDEIREDMMDMSRDLRFHLHQVFAKKPEKKLNAIDPNNIRKAQLVFQKYLSDIIIKTIEIEFELTNAPKDEAERKSQKKKVEDNLNIIDQIIKGAHAKFRDNI